MLKPHCHIEVIVLRGNVACTFLYSVPFFCDLRECFPPCSTPEKPRNSMVLAAGVGAEEVLGAAQRVERTWWECVTHPRGYHRASGQPHAAQASNIFHRSIIAIIAGIACYLPAEYLSTCCTQDSVLFVIDFPPSRPTSPPHHFFVTLNPLPPLR